MSTQPNTRGIGAATQSQLSLKFPMSLAVYDRYDEAQKAVDYLSDHEFPVQDVMIVGTDLKQIERVTGRLSWGRVAMGGLLSGMWIGSFVGLIFALFDTGGSALVTFVTTVAFGALFGLVWALVGYKFTGGQRDFTSVTQVVATKYEVLTEHKHVNQGRELLAEMDPIRAGQEQVRQAQERARAEYRQQGSTASSYAGDEPSRSPRQDGPTQG